MSRFDAEFNLLQLSQRPNWYDHLSDVEAAMADEHRVWLARTQAGWELDEGGWWVPNPAEPGVLIPEEEWEELGLPRPEEVGA